MKKLILLIGLLICLVSIGQTVYYPGTRIFTGTLQINTDGTFNFQGSPENFIIPVISFIENDSIEVDSNINIAGNAYIQGELSIYGDGSSSMTIINDTLTVIYSTDTLYFYFNISGDSIIIDKSTSTLYIRGNVDSSGYASTGPWNQAISDSLPDSVLYATYAGTANALNDTITFSNDQYYTTSSNSVFFDMNNQGVVSIGEPNNRMCEGVSFFTVDDDSLDYSFASDIFSIGDEGEATYLFWISRDSLYYDGYGIFDSTYTLITGWADYILKGSFQKPKFKEIQLFWETNSHLPWIPANGGINKNGYVNQGRLLKQITEAVEYNYLYDAELREEVERLKKENEQLKRQIYLIYNMWKDREYRGDF